MNELRMIDPADAKEKLAIFIRRTEAQLAVVKMVIESMQAMEGKQLTARIATNLKKQFPDLVFNFGKSFSWYELTVAGTGVDRPFDKINLNLGYQSEAQLAVVDVSRITKLNQRYLLDEQRLVEYRAKLETIEEACRDYNRALGALACAQKALEPVTHAVTANNTAYIRDLDGKSLTL